MAQIQRMPFRGSATLGRGVNTLKGEFVGKALKVVSKEQLSTTGQEALFDVQITETHDALMESLGLSVEASGRYGMFSAEGKFSLSEKSKFNASSTFVVASCRVQNAFEMVDSVEVLPEAMRLLEEPERWRTTFGTSFVRGLQTGGELYIVFQTTSTSREAQSSLGISFQAACQGLMAAAEFEMQLNKAKESTSQKTETSILMYQRAGQDERIGYVSDPGEIIKRLREFPAIARANPAGYEVEVADYNTLALPEINNEEVADREMSLTDCARLRLRYMTRRNDIEFARENRQFFVDLPPDEDLADLWEKYSRAVAAVQLHAQKIAGRRIPPLLFDPTLLEPPLDLPVINLRRVDLPSEILVPQLVGNPIDNAKAQLKTIGLEHETTYVTVEENSGKPLNTVIAQDPLAGTKVQPGARVRLTQNVVPGNSRFVYMARTPNPRLAELIRRGG
ncbi:PASTA domain-containing protein [Tautonia rosea]|uniref:PASTA domain-containing protein n=1 Tax=Tautonia rosea TaxID=2728037 RepID=UPI0014753BB2|nr:PASTA domain-containing protein [Tautonia rosea]